MDTSNLKAKANEIKNETVQGRNTANRVGTLFNDIIDALNQIDSAASSVTLNQPLSAINTANMGAGSTGNFIRKKSGGWGYTTISEMVDEIKDEFVSKNYFITYGSDITIDSALSSTSTNPVQNKIINGALGGKQDKLVGIGTGQNIKTINGQNILGSGDITIETGGGGGVSLSLPLSAINGLGNPTAAKSILFYDNSAWGFSTLSSAVADTINNTTNLQNIIKNLVTVSPEPLSGTTVKIATINGTAIYAPTGSTTPGGTTYIENPFDPSSIWAAIEALQGADQEMQDDAEQAKQDLEDAIDNLDEKITEVDNLAKQEKDRLDGVIDEIDSTITNQVDELFRDAEWVQEHISQNVTEWKSNWDGEVYRNVVGWWDGTIDGGMKTKWSQLKQTVSTLEASVNEIYTNGDYTQAFKSFLEQEISDGVASLNLGTLYAEKDAERILRWLYSGLMSHTTNDTTWAQLVSAAKDNDTSAISEIRTYVTKLKNGDYVAVANMAAKVNDAIAELYAEAGDNYAKTYIFSKINQNTQDIATIITEATNNATGATIAAKFANFRAGLQLKSELESAVANLIAAGKFASSGLLLKSDLDSAIAELTTTAGSTVGTFAAKSYVDNAKAEAIAHTNGATAGMLTQATLTDALATLSSSAGNSLGGLVTTAGLDNATAGLMAKNEFTAAAIVAAVNGASSSVTISADHINLTGEALAGYFSTDTTLTSLTNTGLEFRQRGGIGQVGVTSIGYDGLTVAFTNPSWGGGNSACAITPSGVSISYSGQSVSLGINSANGYLTVSNDIEVPGITIGQGGDAVDLVAWMDYVNGYINEGDFVMDSLIVRGTIKTGNYTGTANAQFTTNDGKLVLVQNGIIIGVTQQG